EQQAQALALLARLAEHGGDSRTAQAYRRRAHLMTAPVSASPYATAPDGKGE
ncbi:MAG: hypothetical protein IMZ66_01515, partial [Planctomycetes bacterium]|nr:hypothetical protein [Planctomycetota bacterium]